MAPWTKTRRDPRRRASVLVAALVALCAVLSVLGVRPPASAQDLVSSITTHGPARHEAVTRGDRAEVRVLDRAPRPLDRGRVDAPAAGFSNVALASTLPLPFLGTVGPRERDAWQPPGRARAHLMVFLN